MDTGLFESNAAQRSQVVLRESRINHMDPRRSLDGTRKRTLWIIVTSTALIFAAIMVWPGARQQIQASGFGESVGGFISSEGSSSPDSDEQVALADSPVSGPLAFSDSETGEDSSIDSPTSTDPARVGADGDESSNESDVYDRPLDTVTNTTSIAPDLDEGESNSGTAQPQETTTTTPRQSTSTTASPRSTTSTTSQPASTTSSTRPRPTTTTTTAPTGTPRRPLRGNLYVDPYNVAANWVSNNSGHEFAAFVDQKIASVPTAVWFGDWNNNVESDVRNYVDAARNAGKVPVIVVYNVPNRDCGQFSAGGASSHSEYANWIGDVADGLGTGEAIVILEPDSLALGECLDSNRTSSLNNAVVVIGDHCGECRVYLDAGHSQWVPPAEMASRLTAAGVLNADGFFTNVSNYNATSNEAAFGQQVLSALGNPDGLGQMIDTSRNGNGSSSPDDWCDQQSSALGANPTLSTGSSTVHGYLWIKVPGESDGCVAAAGVFVPEEAVRLATN